MFMLINVTFGSMNRKLRTWSEMIVTITIKKSLLCGIFPELYVIYVCIIFFSFLLFCCWFYCSVSGSNIHWSLSLSLLSPSNHTSTSHVFFSLHPSWWTHYIYMSTSVLSRMKYKGGIVWLQCSGLQNSHCRAQELLYITG